MLPFLKNKQQSVAGLIIKGRTPDQKDPQDQEKPSELEDCAKEIISAMEMKDHKKLAEAMHKAFKCMEEMPHKEIEHDEASPHTYDAQNQKAAE